MSISLCSTLYSASPASTPYNPYLAHGLKYPIWEEENERKKCIATLTEDTLTSIFAKHIKTFPDETISTFETTFTQEGAFNTIIEGISPENYTHHHEKIFLAAIKATDPRKVSSTIGFVMSLIGTTELETLQTKHKQNIYFHAESLQKDGGITLTPEQIDQLHVNFLAVQAGASMITIMENFTTSIKKTSATSKEFQFILKNTDVLRYFNPNFSSTIIIKK